MAKKSLKTRLAKVEGEIGTIEEVKNRAPWPSLCHDPGPHGIARAWLKHDGFTEGTPEYENESSIMLWSSQRWLNHWIELLEANEYPADKYPNLTNEKPRDLLPELSADDFEEILQECRARVGELIEFKIKDLLDKHGIMEVGLSSGTWRDAMRDYFEYRSHDPKCSNWCGGWEWFTLEQIELCLQVAFSEATYL